MQREDAYERAYLAWRTDERTWQAAGQSAKSLARSASSKRAAAHSNAETEVAR